jgi:hypothetical protein
MKTSTRSAVSFAVALVAASSARAIAAGGPERTNVYVECHCDDPVGEKFCGTFQNAVSGSDEYTLASSSTSGYGIGVHFACVDMFKGINDPMAGHMSAVAVAFTIYSEKLPGEVFADTSVFRVGQDAGDKMSDKILDAVGQIAKLNASVLSKMAPQAKESPAAKPKAQPSPEGAGEPPNQ